MSQKHIKTKDKIDLLTVKLQNIANFKINVLLPQKSVTH
jgi:hypothetical protein